MIFGRESDPRNVFISSTSSDLCEYRTIAQQVARNLHLTRTVMEDFESGGRNPPLEECLRRVREEADVLVVIIARRYGWVPSDGFPDLPPERAGKSITWLECLEAREKGIRVLPFVLDDAADWPKQFIEERHPEELIRFKKWIDRNYIAKRFSSAASFQDELTRALDKWKTGDESVQDPERYFQWIFDRAVRTLSTPGREASLEEMYVPLSVHQPPGAKLLESYLSTPYLLITAGPGAGKSTFLAKYACNLARHFKHGGDGRFPVLLPVTEFWNHVTSYSQSHEPGAPVSLDSPRWLTHFLVKESEQRRWGLSGSFFELLLTHGKCAILIDGFDQADRYNLGLLLGQWKRAYPRCQIVLTSRPWAVMDSPGLSQFVHLVISPMDNRTIRKLLLRWNSSSGARPDEAQRHANALYQAVIKSVNVRRLARNPLVLSIIAGEWQKSGNLPSSRGALYEKIITRLLQSTSDVLARSTSHERIEVLQELAWSMQSAATQRVEVTTRWAGERVMSVMPGSTLLAAAKNLDDVAAKTGILTIDRDRLRFWHPTLQEFLTARHLAYAPTGQRLKLLSTELGDRFVTGPWQQVLFFLGQLLESELEDLESLFAYLLARCRTATAPELRTRYAIAAIALRHELCRFPEQLQAEYAEVADTVQAAFASGDLHGIDLAVRIELARLLGSTDLTQRRLEWVDIVAGKFYMGAQRKDPAQPRYDPDALPGEGPVRELYLDAYQISRFPVTVEQYAEFILNDGYKQPDLWRAGGYRSWSSPLRWAEQLEFRNHPVTGVSWYEAAAFCSWAGCRLPTEAEWERAAAGPDGRRFPWGNTLPDHSCANYGRIFGGVTPVGLFPEHASAAQVNDLAGNVWEWVNNEYSRASAEWDPSRISDDRQRDMKKTLRGGSHQNDWQFLRTSERISARPNERYSNFGHVGIRCVRHRS